MPLKQGDIIDEYKNHKRSCRFVARVLDGGTGFSKIVCCGNNLTEDDRVPLLDEKVKRSLGKYAPGTIIDEKKNHPNSCGLKLEVLGGGAGFSHVECCGNRLTWADAV